ncbi:uncharacterized protein PV09_08114 [Verruconis gallopava]|uniref:Actin-related protein 4 n=1 Tax=Verruconis gallopava TaxID=253628 RepID=A0A0D1XDY4_9PEZI|nr:uncharacterized protein PV09_08114 [Verruconis gallopava]KIW00406.1 hypothetical protein PV09_08114 [Verruconis gallopava]
MAAPNQYAQPQPEYGGDEVAALVLDPGYSTTRAGFAGEDTPKSIVPTYYGRLATDGSDENPRILFGENALHTPLPDLEILNPLNGITAEEWVQDWDIAAKLWEFSITSRLTGPKQSDPRTNGLNDANGDTAMEIDAVEQEEKPMSDNPLLMSEPGKTSAKSREKAIQIAMEDWDVPAFWLGRTGVLSAFSSGKSSALVIDIGASGIQVSPILDGILLRKGVRNSPLGGNWISKQIRLMFSQSTPVVPLVPHYMVARKTVVEAQQPSQATYHTFKKPPTESFRLWEEERVLTEFKESVVQTWEQQGRLSSGMPGSTNEDIAKTWPGRPFEMPDGWNAVFGSERFRIPEGLFDENMAYTDDSTPKPKPEQTIPALVKASLASVDSEVRPNLLNNIVVCGGGSLLQGLTRRIDNEVNALYPGPRVRVQASSQIVERKYASWIGGSILGSLGTFHQMWISKKEYQEHGANIIEKRCK